jgi:hypothetical protein
MFKEMMHHLGNHLYSLGRGDPNPYFILISGTHVQNFQDDDFYVDPYFEIRAKPRLMYRDPTNIQIRGLASWAQFRTYSGP